MAGPMKSVRPLLVTLAVIFALVVVAVVLAFTPSVQQWAVRRAVAGQPGLTLDFARLSAGPNRASLENVRFEQDGLIIKAAQVDARYSAWEFLTARRLRIEDLRASGVDIDASQLASTPTATDAAAAPVATPGALARTELPWQVVIGQVNVTGRALLPGAPGRAAIPAEFQLTGGGIAPGAEGELLLKAQLTDPTPEATVSALRADSRLMVRQTNQRTFDRALLTLVVDAAGPHIADQTQLKVAAEMQAVGERETYRLNIDTLAAGRAENLVRVEASVPANADRFSGQWALQVRTEQVAPFYLGGALPQFSTRGGGEFAFVPQTGAFDVRGQLEGEASRLETVDPSLRQLGRLRFDSEFDLAEAEGVARVTRLRANASAEQPLLSLELNRPVSINLETRAVQVGDGEAGDVATLQLHHFPLAWAGPFVSGVQFPSGVVSGRFVVQNGDGRLRLRSTQPTRIDALTVVSDDRPLVERADVSVRTEAVYAAGELTLEGRDFSVRTPAGDRLDGAFAAALSLTDDSAPRTVRATLDGDLPQLLNAFASVGHVRVSNETDLSLVGERIQIRTLRATLARGDGRPLLEVRSVRPFAIEPSSMQVIADGAETELARISIAATPLAALPGLPETLPLQGDLAATEFVATLRRGRLHLSASNPLRLTNVVLQQEGRRMLDGLAFETAPALEFGGTVDWKFTLGQTTVRDRRNQTLASLTAEGSATLADGARVSSTFNFDLAGLGAHPLFTGAQALSAGRASGELRAAWNWLKPQDPLQVEARSTLNGLVLREGNQPLPVANLNFRVLRSADGRLSIDAPVLIDRVGQRSEIRLTAEALQREDGLLFDARIGGDQLELADVLVLSELFATGGESRAPAPAAAPATRPGSAAAAPSGGSSRPAAASAPAPVQPDAEPFWKGVRGELTLNFKSITRGRDWSIRNVSGAVIVDPRRVALQKFEGLINERSRFGARADLRFNDGARPYGLVGNFSLTEFDAGAFLKAFQPDQPPMLEGIVTFAGGFTGDGATLDQTIERTRGHVQLTSSKGVFRGLRRQAEKASVATKAVEIGSALGSILGSSRVRELSERVGGQTYQIDQLVQLLSEIPFDQFVARANRDDQLNIRIEELSLLSPEVRMQGRGALTHVEGKPLLEHPISITYSLAARGKVEEQLARLRVLDGTKDELGYSRMRDTGTIGGTLSRPDASQFFLKLAESKVGEFLAPRN